MGLMVTSKWDDSSGRFDKWLDSRYMLKIGSPLFADGLEMGYEGRKGV